MNRNVLPQIREIAANAMYGAVGCSRPSMPYILPETTRGPDNGPMAIRSTTFVLAVPDADATAQFFIEKLGFETWWQIPGQWHAVGRDSCRLMFGSCPDAIPPKELGDHSYFGYFHVDDADAFHTELTARGLEAERPEDKPWSMREFHVRTPDGHRFTVGQDIPQVSEG